MSPNDRRYAKTHEWVRLEGTTAVVGITDHAQKALGDITFVELPAVGKTVKQGGECGVIESVKAASDLFAPVDGQVAEVNTVLAERPETINKDPYGQGWILKLNGVNGAQMESLMDAAAYEAGIEKDA